MEVNYGVNISYFLWSLAAGGVLALVYDILRTMRRLSHRSVFGVNTEDILFLLLAAAAMFALAYFKNSGRLRWQGFLGTALGLAVYRILIHDRLVNALVRIYEVLARIFVRCVKILLLPAVFIYRMVSKPIIVIGWYSGRSIKRAGGAIRIKREKRRIKAKLKKAEAEKRRSAKRRTAAQADGNNLKNPVDKGKALRYNVK